MPTLRVIDMIEDEFQASFNGKLELDLMEKVCIDRNEQNSKLKTLDECWYLPSLNEDLREEINQLYEE